MPEPAIPAPATECAWCGGPACQTGQWNGLSTPCPSDCCAKHGEGCATRGHPETFEGVLTWPNSD